jgi:two-component system KDP operon response regulator KdpE
MKLPRSRCRGLDLPQHSGSANGHHGSEPEWIGSIPRSETAPASLRYTPAFLTGGQFSGKILLVDHDAEIRGLVRFGLEQQGFDVLEASTANECIEMAIGRRPGAILLDMGVTDSDGLEVVKRLREWSHIPILALSGRNASSSAISALDTGANDYITRPFNVEELAARLRAALRCAPPPTPEIFRSGSLSVDLTNRTVKVGSRTVGLSVTEYSLLRLFVRHAGRLLTHAQILREVWGSELVDKVEYLRVYLLALRRKLKIPSEPDLFLTERGVGYKLMVREPSGECRELEPD